MRWSALSVSDGTPTLLLPTRVGVTGSGAPATDAVFVLALVLALVLRKIEESVLVLVLVLEKLGYPLLDTRYSYSNFE